jgi:hypothetical protein
MVWRGGHKNGDALPSLRAIRVRVVIFLIVPVPFGDQIDTRERPLTIQQSAASNKCLRQTAPARLSCAATASAGTAARREPARKRKSNLAKSSAIRRLVAAPSAANKRYL